MSAMVVYKKSATAAGERQTKTEPMSADSCGCVSGAEFAAVVKTTFAKVEEARSSAATRTGFAVQLADSLTEQVLAMMTEDAQGQFWHYETLRVLTAEAQQERNAMRSRLASTAKDIVRKAKQILECNEEPQENANTTTKQVIEEAYAQAAVAGDDLKKCLLEQKAAIVAKLDEDFSVALQQVDMVKESLVAKNKVDLLKLIDGVPMQRECPQHVLDAFGLTAAFLQKLRVEEVEEAAKIRVEDDKRLDQIKLKEEHFANMNMDPSRPAYAELLHEKQGILEWRTKHGEKMQEHKQLSEIVDSVRKRTEKAGVGSPPAKKRRLWFWQGA